MANALYPLYKQALLDSTAPDLSSVDIKAILVDLADYTYSTAHEFLTSVAAGARVETTAALGSKSITNGVFDAADTVFSSVTGDESEALILYYDSGVEGTSRLLAYLDTGITGLPVTPNGGDINVAWDDGASKVFAL